MILLLKQQLIDTSECVIAAVVTEGYGYLLPLLVIAGRAKLMPVPMMPVPMMIVAAVILVVCVYQHRCYCATAIDTADDAMASMPLGYESNGTINE